jgi:hypothetical protein
MYHIEASPGATINYTQAECAPGALQRHSPTSLFRVDSFYFTHLVPKFNLAREELPLYDLMCDN